MPVEVLAASHKMDHLEAITGADRSFGPKSPRHDFEIALHRDAISG